MPYTQFAIDSIFVTVILVGLFLSTYLLAITITEFQSQNVRKHIPLAQLSVDGYAKTQEAAILDAQSKARNSVLQLGVQLGRIISFSSNTSHIDTPDSVGTSVTITYEVEEKHSSAHGSHE